MKMDTELLDLLNLFTEKYRMEEQKLPYHINVLDLVKVNENAHSRIFAELLKQNEGGSFGILNSFFEYLNTNLPDIKLAAKSPKITTEKERIDLLILDDEYALIIENKVHNAIDQKSQIARYIKKVINKGYSDKQIFIIYLTRDNNKIIQEQSWGEGLKYRFEKHYHQITFRTDILTWLKEYVLPNCKIKDIYLKSSVDQYIDHLEGMFNERKNQQVMNEELQKELKEKLGIGLSKQHIETRIILEKKLNDVKNLETQLNNLLLINGEECFGKWGLELELMYGEEKTINKFEEDDEIHRQIGLKSNYQDLEFLILLEYNVKSGKIYYGMGIHDCSNYKYEKVISLAKKIDLNNFISENDKLWYGWKYTEDLSEGFNDLTNLINKVNNAIEGK